MINKGKFLLWFSLLMVVSISASFAQNARVKEYRAEFPTYLFSDPDPVPNMGIIYPYFRFDGYSANAKPRNWKMVEMENDYIRVFITPEIGGKIWGAIEKSTGKEFIYYNHAVKFRDIAMRGPWTSGGIEINFGSIGHAPTCSTPVNYLKQTNPDGSVSCIVGALDLPSRTQWRVKITIPPDKAWFTTNAIWINPTPLEQSYYHWMNGSVKSSGNLEFVYPGQYHLGHGGKASPWPTDSLNRKISWYNKNDFGSYKSYHVFGNYTNFFGGYWHENSFGFGHYSPYDEKPGKKIWIWGLSRQGMLWEDLLTDTDGQYVEIQTGRLFNQAGSNSTYTPFKHLGFTPFGADTWSEYWFPVKKTYGLRRGIPEGTINFVKENNQLNFWFCANEPVDNRLLFFHKDTLVYSTQIQLDPMEVLEENFLFPGNPNDLSVRLDNKYIIGPGGEKNQDLSRPVKPSGINWGSQYGLYITGKEAERQRMYEKAKRNYLACLDQEPWFIPALNGMAHLCYRSMEYEKALKYVTKALRMDTYDPRANFLYGVINKTLGNTYDALDGFSIASASQEYRSAAYTEMAGIYIKLQEWSTALDYAGKSQQYNTYNIPAHQMEALILRKTKNSEEANQKRKKILELDPLNHFCRFESGFSDSTKRSSLKEGITAELPHEYFLELALWYYDLCLHQEAKKVLQEAPSNPMVNYWLAWLNHQEGNADKAKYYLEKANSVSTNLVFPFRHETIPILQWSINNSESWKPGYYLGLVYWSKQRIEKARELFLSCGDEPGNSSFYLARSKLFRGTGNDLVLNDLKNATSLAPEEWRTGYELSEYYLDTGNTQKAQQVIEDYYKRFQENYYLGLLLAKTLLVNNDYYQCVKLLDTLQVLPNEGATEGHRIYHEAHKRLVMENYKKGKYQAAMKHIEKARLWPENLGVGKPYNPNERVGNFLAVLPYGTGSWDSEQLGNHRVVLYVDSLYDAVRVHIPWRRRDKHPEKKRIILTDTTGKVIKNLLRKNISRISADLVFQPVYGSGLYYLYYMPYRLEGTNYPTAIYLEPDDQSDPEWVLKNKLDQPGSVFELAEAKAVEMQSVNKFNSFFPMEVIASEEEVNALITNYSGRPYLVFPENRKFPIRLKQDLPYRWIKMGPSSVFNGTACKNEYYAFQLGIFAASGDIGDISVSFKNLKEQYGPGILPASAFTCFNTEGINWDGKPFDKMCIVEKGNVQPLWIGIDIPRDLPSGKYNGTLTVHPAGLDSVEVDIVLKVTDQILEDRGDGEPWRHSRLRWLNSKLAMDYEVVDPFLPLTNVGDTLSCLGRDLVLGKDGLPRQILSRFAPEVTHLTNHTQPLLSGPIKFRITDKNNKNLTVDPQGYRITETKDGIIRWTSKTGSDKISIIIEGSLEADGLAQFRIRVEASEKISVKDAELIIPMEETFSKYMMGLGYKGGYRPENIQWKWDIKHNQEGAWLGNTNGGIQFALRGSNYARPLNTNFYLTDPLKMPDSWYNHGLGGINIQGVNNGTTRVRAFSGSRILEPGQPLLFDLLLWITPFKPINTGKHWENRYYHSYQPVDTIKETGATVINIHHANEVNPYINYPFLSQDKMFNYINEAHQKGMKVKIYNTIRELSNHAPELFAIRSLGNEIFSEGPGGGYSWLYEHVGDDYIAAWFVAHLKDAAIVNSGMSRWHNYYVEGLDWLAKNMSIDGLYIDDIAFDRTTMKRVRKVLDRNRPEALIDLHSANQYNVRDGFINSASLYLEHFPYIDRLWFGEYFDKDAPPDFWLVEMSGIPYGLMGEMLQDGGNQWRGMVYGMTARLPWAGDPKALWKIWDSFGIKESRMVGYWSPDCPVATGNSKVLATAYIKQNSVMIAIGSWAEKEEKVKLEIDWKSLGISPEQSVLYAPDIQNFQSATSFDPNNAIPVKPGEGWLLILKKNE